MRKRRLLAVPAVLAAAAAVGLAVAPSGAHADVPTLLGWTAQANANVLDIVVDDANGLSGIHPLDEIDMPEDSSDFETGPYGHSLASVFWPGATGGNLGSLSGELGLPSQIAPLASKTNDTFKAESFYPAGPQTDSYPPNVPSGVADMKTSTTEDGSTATSDLSNLTLAGVLQVQGSYGTSQATASSEATASATGSFSQLSLFGGLITVGATTSTASATSTGSSASGSGTTHLGAITIAGQQASVGSDGLVLGPASTTLLGGLLGSAESTAQTLISTLGLSVKALPETVTSSGAVEQVTSGGLQISFSLPASGSFNITCPSLPSALSQLSVLCTLPGLLQGASVTITIGQATAEAIATPPFGLDDSLGSAPPTQTGAALPISTPAATSALPSSALAGSSPISQSALPSSGSGSPSIAPSSAPASAGTSPAQSSAPQPSTEPISLSSPVKTGTVVGMLLLALLLAAGAIGLGSRIDGPAAAACPNGETPPPGEEPS